MQDTGATCQNNCSLAATMVVYTRQRDERLKLSHLWGRQKGANLAETSELMFLSLASYTCQLRTLQICQAGWPGWD